MYFSLVSLFGPKALLFGCNCIILIYKYTILVLLVEINLQMNKNRTIPFISCCICVRWIHDIYIWSHVTVQMLVLWVLNPTAIMAPF